MMVSENFDIERMNILIFAMKQSLIAYSELFEVLENKVCCLFLICKNNRL